ncbi:unnamed protein product [Gadus morhua 'NCC']
MKRKKADRASFFRASGKKSAKAKNEGEMEKKQAESEDEEPPESSNLNGPPESLRHVFTWLGFQVEVVRDATRDQMLSSMRELASRDHSGMDCVACVVLIAWS